MLLALGARYNVVLENSEFVVRVISIKPNKPMYHLDFSYRDYETLKLYEDDVGELVRKKLPRVVRLRSGSYVIFSTKIVFFFTQDLSLILFWGFLE